MEWMAQTKTKSKKLGFLFIPLLLLSSGIRYHLRGVVSEREEALCVRRGEPKQPPPPPPSERTSSERSHPFFLRGRRRRRESAPHSSLLTILAEPPSSEAQLQRRGSLCSCSDGRRRRDKLRAQQVFKKFCVLVLLAWTGRKIIFKGTFELESSVAFCFGEGSREKKRREALLISSAHCIVVLVRWKRGLQDRYLLFR